MSLTIRLMTVADVAFGMTLKQANGWNQLSADWQRFLAMEPDGCFVAEWDEDAVGTTCTCMFGSVAWIAMVLVDERYRGRGIGTALMEHALAYLESKGASTIRLDATALGRPVYEKLGFVAEYTLGRYEGTLPHFLAAENVDCVPASGLETLRRFDQAITGTDRGKMLTRFHAENPAGMRWGVRESRVQGYLFSRVGSRARQIGPCLATEAAGLQLVADACQRYPGKYVYMDIPLTNTFATEFVQAFGLRAQRQLLRMTKGPRVQEDVNQIWASSGPEKG